MDKSWCKISWKYKGCPTNLSFDLDRLFITKIIENIELMLGHGIMK